MVLVHETASWKVLQRLAQTPRPHLRELLKDNVRSDAFFVEWDGIAFDYTRELVTDEVMQGLMVLANEVSLQKQINSMFQGEAINQTEGRSVLHTALRAPKSSSLVVNGVDVIAEVHAVREKIRQFSESVRNGEWLGFTGKPLTDIVAIGIGGSFLGPAFIHTALETHTQTAQLACGRRLRFLANVDPEDVSRALSGLDPEKTLVIVVSKTFTTAETMLNARTVKTWLVQHLGEQAIPKHMVAVSTALKLVEEFGIDPKNAFGFWDWVGGRYSASSAVGILPLSLHYGYGTVEKFLDGMHTVDTHFHTAPFDKNIPVLMGMLAVWNTTFMNISANAILPYCQGLSKLAPHIQQLSMESNGKGVTMEGEKLNFEAGEIIFGEPGTNGQHSFYQLIHQGRLVSCDLIGFAVGQQDIYLPGEPVSNHDELMCNYFAQADALAYGKTPEELRAQGEKEDLIGAKTFSGNRPSLSLLMPHMGPREIGQLLALYEHRIIVQGFLWGINSFDQWGVELGKVLAKQVRNTMSQVRGNKVPLSTAGNQFNRSTQRMMSKYMDNIDKSIEGLQYSNNFASPFNKFSRGLDGAPLLFKQ